MKEEAEEIKRREEEAERRRMARLMEDIEGDQEDGGAGGAIDGMKDLKKPSFRLNSDDDDYSERDDDKVFQGFDNSDEFDSDEEDDLEREFEGKPRLNRHRSAKALGGGSENLNSKRITSDEYMH